MNKFVFFFLLLISFSCTKEVDLDIPDLPQKVVVNSLFCPDSVLKIHVSLTANITDSIINFVDNATVKLYENDILISTINTQQNGFYNSMYIPKVGKEYRVEVEVPGFDVVWAESSIPKNAVVDSFLCDLSKVSIYDGENSLILSEFIFNSDKSNGLNYYEIPARFFYQQFDESILAENVIEQYPLAFCFSDQLFKSSHYKLVLNGYYDQVILDPLTGAEIDVQYTLPFKTISKEYYNFRKSWTNHVFNQNGDTHYDDPLTLLFLGDPIEMYTNISGGYGVFAGYNVQLVELECY
jgi:hypothetical protein